MSRHNVGCKEYGNGDHVAAMRHLRLSASGGIRKSMDCLIAALRVACSILVTLPRAYRPCIAQELN